MIKFMLKFYYYKQKSDENTAHGVTFLFIFR
jgi:hypothetical protein